MKIHKGTFISTGQPTAWVETRTKWEFDLNDLINGLCSHYRRHCDEDEDPDLPEPGDLAATAVLRYVRQEYVLYGTNAVWTWSEEEDLTPDEDTEARAWARSVILAVLPGLEVPA